MLRSPLIDQLVGLRRDGWTARSHLGNLALLASTALASGRVPAPPAMIAAQQEIGRMRLAWSQVQTAAALPGMPAELVALVGRLDAVLAGPVAQERDAALAELIAGRLPQVDHDAFRNRQVPPIAQIAELPTAAAEAMVAQARAELAAARLGLALGAALLVAALAIGLGGILATRRLVARPVTDMTEAMRRLAGGDLDVAVPRGGPRPERRRWPRRWRSSGRAGGGAPA